VIDFYVDENEVGADRTYFVIPSSRLISAGITVLFVSSQRLQRRLQRATAVLTDASSLDLPS
jgi:hypothetical protein